MSAPSNSHTSRDRVWASSMLPSGSGHAQAAWNSSPWSEGPVDPATSERIPAPAEDLGQDDSAQHPVQESEVEQSFGPPVRWLGRWFDDGLGGGWAVYRLWCVVHLCLPDENRLTRDVEDS